MPSIREISLSAAIVLVVFVSSIVASMRLVPSSASTTIRTIGCMILHKLERTQQRRSKRSKQVRAGYNEHQSKYYCTCISLCESNVNSTAKGSTVTSMAVHTGLHLPPRHGLSSRNPAPAGQVLI
ncbi:hypothetical protein BS47DRAFT_867656 [Hydnum rufescens UP504]|uniref:Uncharacterized protein n=1 Tax=Hydnum rufescens UP504 TaxID=1448309 RepID=A0A9P6B1H7_9AGAM|nr:hypothetical protein BS47DRAFT_867656 [Hydnum rufescens UP504]